MPKLDSYTLAKPSPDYHTEAFWKELFSSYQNNINLSLVHSDEKNYKKYFLELYIIIIVFIFAKCFFFQISKSKNVMSETETIYSLRISVSVISVLNLEIKELESKYLDTHCYCTVTRVDKKLCQPDQMTQYSSISGMEIFIRYADQGNLTSSDYDDGFKISGIFLQFYVLPDLGKHRMGHRFPTIL